LIGFALDMDGTLYKGEDPIPGARECVWGLRERGIPFRFVTNNSSHPRSFYTARLNRMGFEVTDDEVLTSTVATCRFLRDRRHGKTVHVIATPEVTAEIAAAGVPLAQPGEQPDIVLLTFDTSIDYAKINTGYHYLLAGAELVATHPDDVCPNEISYDVDIGPFIRLYETLTGRAAVVVGKPHRLMLNMAAAEMDVAPEKVLMVGDRLSTDMRMAIDAGARSVLVLSGETDQALLESSGLRPTYVLNSVADLLPLVDRLSGRASISVFLSSVFKYRT